MPFKSEKQRRYLWANEPEIAREWTDRYGAAGGGIMDIASDGNLIHDFENYKKGKRVNVPTSFQARSHSTPVNLAYITDEEAGILQALKPDTPHEGPMGIPNYNDYDPTGGYRSGAAMSAAESGKHTSDTLAAGIGNQELQNIRSGAIAAGAGQTVNPGWFGPRHRPGISKQDLRAAKQFAPKAYRATRGSPFGIGNLFRGALSMFGGIPGSMMSMFSRIDPRQLRGKNPDGSWRTQQQYEDARRNKQLQSRLDKMYRNKALNKGFSQKNIDMLEAMGLKPSTAQNVLTGRDLNLRGKELTDKLSAPKRSWDNFDPPTGTHYPGSYDENDYYTGTLSFEDQVARNKAKLESMGFEEATGGIMDNYNYNNMKMMEVANNPALSRYRQRQEFAPTKFHDPWAGPKFQQVVVNEDQMKTIDQMAGMYNRMENPGYKLNTEQQQNIFDAAKQQDTKEKEKVFGFIPGTGQEADPMTEQEYKDYLVSKGYI